MILDLQMLNECILESGLKKKYIAQLCEMSEATLSKILNGKQKCGINEYLAICGAIGQPFEKFIDEADRRGA